MAGARQSLTVGLTVLALAAAIGVTGVLWLRADPHRDLEEVLSKLVPQPPASAPRRRRVAPAPPTGPREEADYLADIERRPRFADYRYAYALYLYHEGRIDEASEQLGHLFSVKDSHPEAEMLHAHINELEATPDPAERAAKRDQFVAQTPALAAIEAEDAAREREPLDAVAGFEEASPGEEPLGASPADRPLVGPLAGPLEESIEGSTEDALDPHLRALDAKYGISTYPWAWVPSSEELQRGALVSRLEAQQKYNEAEAMHREQLRAYPQSPDSIRAYVVFLIGRGQFEIAREQLTRALEQFPSYPELLIVGDALSEIEATNAPGEQSVVWERLEATLSDAALIRMSAAGENVATE